METMKMISVLMYCTHLTFREKIKKDFRKLGIGFAMKKGETLKTKLFKLKP